MKEYLKNIRDVISRYLNPMAIADIYCHNCKGLICSTIVSRLINNTEDQIIKSAEYYMYHKNKNFRFVGTGLLKKKEIHCQYCGTPMPGGIDIKYRWRPFPGEKEMWKYDASKKPPLIRVTIKDKKVVGFLNDNGKLQRLEEPLELDEFYGEINENSK